MQSGSFVDLIHLFLNLSYRIGINLLIFIVSHGMPHKDRFFFCHGTVRSDVAPSFLPHQAGAGAGQNAVSQAKLFTQAAPITGVVLTKLDGTAKGGVVIGIKAELNMPIKWIGVGEGVADLRPFVAEDFSKALFGEGQEAETK